ncbi:hypothetical protein HFN80_07205 [Rhizobium laguerreae]|uniref:DUF5801 domain-containing protein n=1 Tax=Rhizobium laguerreae TaxID=1076926 RepID=A0AAX2QPG2_9HYPH|nr:DUF5801 repeats-in-toxin domain-containing protein [Rhizobium laguerreae]MBY3323433.1 hypothetical protein [Rhizobium laguerreae]MBY3463802.1 hypothetical protein [Rhizobium laguerreae]NKM31287.1 hypothetical protein [Rhizobium laguerreae]TCU26030.1 hypothetical protein EV131_104177 [Rhizobium laguerreae]
MALDITTQDIIIDETTGLTDDDINPATPPHNANTTLQYLLGLDVAGGLTSPEVAYQSNFVVASASAGETITSVVLTQNASGTPFSTTVGVNSGVRTVDGNYVWLFQDPTRPNVVIGVIGTSNPLTEPVETGPLAFSLALIGSGAAADLYTVQYVPLFHTDATNADDRIDLTNKVFASVSGTSVVNFSQLGDAPSGHNNWYILDADAASPQKILVTAHDNGVQAEVNVSTQGLGVASQDVRFGRELQIDLITGGTQSAGKDFTNAPTAPDYGTHLENVSTAGFSISQSTPTSTVADIEIHAYNNDDNVEGAAFPTDDNDAEINITGVTFKLNGVTKTAAELGITVNLAGTGLILEDVGEGVTIDFTTAGGAGGTFDRFTIKNIDTEKDFFDVKEVHYGGEVSNAYNEEVGSFINFDDDGPSITATGSPPELTVDETVLATNDSGDFATFFTSNAGADGGAITYALGISQVTNVSGLTDTATGQSVLLFVEGGNVVGRAGAGGPVVFTVSVTAAGLVSLDQARAVVHADASDPDDSITLAAADLVTLTATITDGDGDHAAATHNIGQSLNFEDDKPIIGVKGGPFPLTVDDTDLTTNVSADFGAYFVAFPGADGIGNGITYALGINPNNNVSGLTDTETGQSVLLFLESGSVVGRAGAGGPVVFTVSVSAAGVITLDQARAVVHADANNPDDITTLAASDITLTATITDGDGDQATSTRYIGQSLYFQDDGPTITVPFDGNPALAGIQHETLANVLNASASGAFGYNIGADVHPAAFYTGGGSDFVDEDGGTTGVQIGLTGTITGGGGGNLVTSNVTLASESLTSATFNFTFTYDKDPAAGVQAGTAGGTLVFDKAGDTYTVNLTDPLEGFSFDVLHTSQLLSKEPTGNTGHPQIVLERLQADDANTPDDEDFYVQFTGNAINRGNPFSLTNNGQGSSADSTFTIGGHEMVSNNNPTWVSATQSTNGVAGDTIQKDELLTLRFFNSNVGIANEATTPTATAGTMAIKFDGIGNSEDLMLILNLIDKNGADNIAGTADDNTTITRAMYVSNDDIYKTGQVPTAYSSEFTLDQNDGLVIVEQNDYNAAGEDYVLQGAQIMQSGNGITGNNTAIDLVKATGANGGSNATGGLVNFDATDNDVLKITDIGFTSTVTETPNANLDFAFQVEDADGDQTAMQHILVDVA